MRQPRGDAAVVPLWCGVREGLVRLVTEAPIEQAHPRLIDNREHRQRNRRHAQSHHRTPYRARAQATRRHQVCAGPRDGTGKVEPDIDGLRTTARPKELHSLDGKCQRRGGEAGSGHSRPQILNTEGGKEFGQQEGKHERRDEVTKRLNGPRGPHNRSLRNVGGYGQVDECREPGQGD